MINPRLNVRIVKEAQKFYNSALGAEVVEEYYLANGECAHCAIKISGSILSLTDIQFTEKHHVNDNVTLMVEVDDVDLVCDRFKALGGTILIEPDDRYYGHRDCRAKDPFGFIWMPFQVIEDLSPKEVEQRSQNTLPLD